MTKSWACAIAGLLVVAGCSSTTSSGSGDDAGGATDSSGTHDSSAQDSASMVDSGAADTAPTLTGCLTLLQCENACSTQACLTMCEGNATPAAKALYKTLGDCIDVACPQTAGGVCATASAACDACVMASQDPPIGPTDAGDAGDAGASTQGMCYSQDQACANDAP